MGARCALPRRSGRAGAAFLPRLAVGTRTAAATVWLPPGEKLRQLLFPFTNYNLALDTATGLDVLAFLVFCAVTRRMRAPRHVVIALAGLAALYTLSPYELKGTQSLDTRFTLMFALLLFAGLQPVRVTGAVAGFAVLVTARMAVVAAAWHGHAAELAQLRSVTRPMWPPVRK